MKKGIEENLKDLKSLYRLSKAEKEESFSKIEAFMRKNPLPEKSPFAFHTLILKGFNYYTVAAVVFAMTGLSLYAEGTLPGEYLYHVKVEVNDSLKVLSSLTPESKARAHIAIIKERIQDIDEAVEQGTIDTSSLEYAASSIEEHTDEVASIVAISQEEGDLATSLEISEELEENLEIAIVPEDTTIATMSTLTTLVDDTASSTLEATTTVTITATFEDVVASTTEEATLMRAVPSIEPEEVEENLKNSKARIERFIEDHKKSIDEDNKLDNSESVEDEVKNLE